VKRLSTDDFASLDTRLEQEIHADRGVAYQETVRRLAPKIQQLRDQGVSFDRIVDLLKESGFVVSASTLRSYLRRARKARDRASSTRTVGGRPPTAPTAEASNPAPPRALASRSSSTAPQPVKPPASGDGGKKEGDATTNTPGHFVVEPDSERI
jgi:hypothetical protein